MIKINKIDGDVKFEIEDDLFIRTELYGKNERICLYNFDGANRSINYRNSSFFPLQSQSDELKRIHEQALANASRESEFCCDFMIAARVFHIYSRFAKPVCSLWIGDKCDLSSRIDGIIKKFNSGNCVVYTNDINLLNHLSSFACVFINERYFFRAEVSGLCGKLYKGGELLILGNQNMNAICINLAANASLSGFESWSFDSKEYFISLMPKEYEFFCDDYAAKKKVCEKLRAILFPVMNLLSLIDAENGALHIDECVNKLEKAANITAKYCYMFNNEDLRFEILELQNALLDLKFQKEIYGAEDNEYYLNEISQKNTLISEFLSKDTYEM